MEQKVYDVAVIGSGPAGFTAAIYTSRGAASTIIFAGESWGGQLMLTTQVDNYPGLPGILGPDLMQKMRDHATMFGAEFMQRSAEAIDVGKKPFEITAGGNTFKAKSIIVATGAETEWLDAPGIQKLVGRGVSSCASCDAPFFKGKKAAVVGGGDSAMEEALALTKYATEVIVIHRRDEFRASAAMQEKVKQSAKIKTLWNTEIQEAIGEKSLEKLVLKNNKTGENSELAVSGLFIAIGHTPSTTIFKGKIDLDQKGYVKLYDHAKTSVPGVFVAGDVHDFRYKQAVTAAGFGCMAAMDALDFLQVSGQN